LPKSSYDRSVGAHGARPAFYALAPGGWRDYVTLLHLPYTLWCVSYVAIGAALAPALHPARLGAAAGAFALAVGVAAHALDELRGRPLGTEIPAVVLGALAAATLAGAAAIGIVVAIQASLWLLAFVAFGAFVVPAYNLELFGGRFHSDLWFALAWGAFPLLTGYFSAAVTIRAEAVLAAAFAALASAAQRRLSTHARAVRRRGLDAPLADVEAALRALAAAVVALAAALLTMRLT
jgi:hypothetical protein